MDVRIKTTDYQLTPQVADYLDERMRSIEKHLGQEADATRCEVELGRAAGHSNKGKNWFAEFQIIYPGSDIVRAVGRAESVNAAIDAAKDEIMVVLKKDKTKKFVRTKRLGAQIKNWLRFGN